MARVKRAVASKKHRKATLERAKGYYGNKSRSYRAANEQVMHSLQYAYRDRRARKGDFRQLWIQRINAACRLNGMTYSEVHRRPEGRRDRGRPQGPRRSRRHRSGGVHRPGRGGRRRVGQRLNLLRPPAPVGVEPTPLSASNSRLNSLRRLSGRRRARLQAGAFVIEGPIPVGEVLAAGAVLEDLFVDATAWADAEPGSALHEAVTAASAAGTPVWSLPPGVLARVADTVTPQGLLGVAPRRPTPLDDLLAPSDRPGPVLVLVDVADPGNAGTLVRTAEAAGAAGVVFTGTSTDPYGPKAVRAAAGALLRLPVAEAPDLDAALPALRAAGLELVATVASGGDAPEEASLTGRVAVLVGSEAHGLAPAVVAATDRAVTIPLAAGVDSLNAAVAGAVVLFEAARQRRVGTPGTDWTTAGSTDRLGDR